MSSDEDAPVPESDDQSAKAFGELIRILEAAASTGVESVGLEWKGEDLMVFHESGGVGYGVTRIAKHLQLDVLRKSFNGRTLDASAKGTCHFASSGKSTVWPLRNTIALVKPPSV